MELSHHGILGQKWGVRRYQNPDGTRTAAGKRRYSVTTKSEDETVDIDGDKVTIRTTKHTISSGEGSEKGKEKIDKLARKEDFDTADEEIDTRASKVIREYEKNGKDAALDLLQSEFEDYTFNMVIEESEIIEYGAAYTTYVLSVMGKENIYSTSGDRNYSDDQSFIKLKK